MLTRCASTAEPASGVDLDKLDPMAIFQNLSCEVEKLMGIFPNVPELTAQGTGGEQVSTDKYQRLRGAFDGGGND